MLDAGYMQRYYYGPAQERRRAHNAEVNFSHLCGEFSKYYERAFISSVGAKLTAAIPNIDSLGFKGVEFWTFSASAKFDRKLSDEHRFSVEAILAESAKDFLHSTGYSQVDVSTPQKCFKPTNSPQSPT